jgi:hypothetical protein
VYDARNKPDSERRMPDGEKRKSGGSLIPLVTVLGTLLMGIVGLIVLAGRAGMLILAAVAAVLALPLLHYITWGWWLSRSLGRPKDDSVDDAND